MVSVQHQMLRKFNGASGGLTVIKLRDRRYASAVYRYCLRTIDYTARDVPRTLHNTIYIAPGITRHACYYCVFQQN